MGLSKIKKDCIPVVLASDENYAKYLAITIQSIIVNVSDTNRYEIIVFDGGISEEDKQKIAEMIYEIKNVQLRFFLVENKVEGVDFSQLKITQYITRVTYFRLFIPQILLEYSKCIYLDCDLVVNCDVAELYKQDLNNCLLAATQDYGVHEGIKKGDPDCSAYFKTLQLSPSEKYFNAGVLIMDLDEMRKQNIKEQLLNKLEEIKNPRYWDQSILNAVFKGKVKFLDYSYNFQWYFGEDDKFSFPKELQPFFDHPKIVHYISSFKPWVCKRNNLASYFWKYAKQTPFYETIKREYEPFRIKNRAQNIKKYKKYNRRNIIALGLHKRWRKKRNQYKRLIEG